MTDKERQLVKQAAHSVIAATSTYCELLEKRMKQSDGSAEQIQEIGDSLRALNHATVAMERLCRILDGPEPGKGGENQTFSHSDKSVGTSST